MKVTLKKLTVTTKGETNNAVIPYYIITITVQRTYWAYNTIDTPNNATPFFQTLELLYLAPCHCKTADSSAF